MYDFLKGLKSSTYNKKPILLNNQAIRFLFSIKSPVLELIKQFYILATEKTHHDPK